MFVSHTVAKESGFAVMMTSLRGLLNDIWSLLHPTDDFCDWIFRENRTLAIFLYVVCGLQWSTLWVWDWVIDPVGAQETMVLRSSYLLGEGLALLFFLSRRRHWSLAAVTLLSAAFFLVIFLAILTRLQTGMVWGIGGFMYCTLISVVLFQCFSLAVNLFAIFALPLVPPFCAALGMAPDFYYIQYAALIGPATLLGALIQVAIACRALERYRLQRHLEDLSNTDPLTGVRNRRSLLPLVRAEIARVRRLGGALSVLMLDIDHFKRINDSFGHDVGDAVIRRTTEICRHLSRDIDTVGRLGGEEFALLLPGTSLYQARSVAERIRSEMERTSFCDRSACPFQITVSIGVAELAPTDQDERDLLNRADTALYRAKQSGRNRVSSIEQEDG